MITRRKFVGSISSATAYAFVAVPMACSAQKEKVQTIQDVIDFLISQANGAPFDNTVDTVKSADSSQKVKGIVTTFMANSRVIQKAIELGANMIITHEPTYYNHRDNTDWIENDAVYQYKRQLLEDNNIVVWRFHDYIHAYQPDPIMKGLADKLGWQPYVSEEKTNIFTLPEQTVGNLAKEIKQRLGSKAVWLVGDENMACSKIGLLPGASGGKSHINFLSGSDIEVLVVGEIAEWETSEYVRDAISAGQKKALVVAGHAPTEEPGMQWLAGWLDNQFPGIAVAHVPGEAPFVYL